MRGFVFLLKFTVWLKSASFPRRRLPLLVSAKFEYLSLISLQRIFSSSYPSCLSFLWYSLGAELSFSYAPSIFISFFLFSIAETTGTLSVLGVPLTWPTLVRFPPLLRTSLWYLDLRLFESLMSLSSLCLLTSGPFLLADCPSPVGGLWELSDCPEIGPSSSGLWSSLVCIY